MICENCGNGVRSHLAKVSNIFDPDEFMKYKKDLMYETREFLVLFCPNCGDLRLKEEDWKKMKKFCEENDLVLENIG